MGVACCGSCSNLLERSRPVLGLFDSHDPSATSTSIHAQVLRSSTGNLRPFETLDQSFRLLVCEPTPLALEGAAVGHGLPIRLIPLGELRRLLLDPSVGFDARDAA